MRSHTTDHQRPESKDPVDFSERRPWRLLLGRLRWEIFAEGLNNSFGKHTRACRCPHMQMLK